jgi:sRNA-binding carbon storage regulator CsrA
MMLVLSREVGEAIIIEDVVLTLAQVADGYVDVSLRKTTGGRRIVLALPHHQRIEICYGVEAVFIDATSAGARLGFDHPPEVTISRLESIESGDGD